MPAHKTIFKEEWLQEPAFKFISSAPGNPHVAYCKVCFKTIELSNMGRRAVSSHVEGKKHIAIVQTSKTSNVLAFAVKAQQKPSVADVPAASADLSESATPERPPALDNRSTLPTSAQVPVTNFLSKDEVTVSEILWCLQTVDAHMSLSAAGKCTTLFQRMFPDSRIAESMRLGRAKMAYNIVYGLAPYFFSQVLKEVGKESCFVISFDESLNKFSQVQQMDLAIRYWSDSKDQVCARYFNSSFLGHSTAVDLLKGFLDAVNGLNLQHLLQVSMDGPNVNFKFLRELESHLKATNPEDSSEFLQMGSCGLHTTHNSFKCGEKTTKWGIVAFMRACYNVFKNVPARRTDYIRYSGSQKLPKKFCAVRWLDNASVAETCLSIVPNLQKFVDGCKRDKIVITSESYKTMTKSLTDKLLKAKLSFFAMIARMAEKFLEEFQSDAPLAPFLHTELTLLITNIMEIFVKDEVLKKASSAASIDLNKPEN